MRHTHIRISTTKTLAQKVALAKASSEGRRSLTKRERQMEAFESQRCTIAALINTDQQFIMDHQEHEGSWKVWIDVMRLCYEMCDVL